MTNLSDKITIVIPCYNEVNYIGKLLTDISNQSGINGTRVIIADNNSTDGTRDVIRECSKKFTNLEILVVQGGNVSEGRNNGATYCYTEYILFIDSDVRLFNNITIYTAYLMLEMGGKRLITAKLKSYSDSFMSKVAFKVWNVVHKLLSKKYSFAIGLFMGLRIQDFRRCGKFDIRNDNSEDFLFSQNFEPREFYILNKYVGQDDRRFRKLGYFGMAKHLFMNFIGYVRGDVERFKKRSKYWDE